MTGDLIAGLLLSQIVYWFLPNKHGRSKLKVSKDNLYWLAKQQSDWWKEIRISEKQAKRAIDLLVKLGIIVKTNHLFNNKRINHIRINEERFMELWQQVVE